MKKPIKVVVAICIAVAISFLGFISTGLCAKGKVQNTAPADKPLADTVKADVPDLPDGFDTPGEWSKLDPKLQATWLDAKKAGNMDQRLDCFVRVRAPADMGDESFLFSHGFVVRVFSGPVASGHVTVGDLPGVAKLPFVDSIKLSTK